MARQSPARSYLQKVGVMAEEAIVDGVHKLLIPSLPLLNVALLKSLHLRSQTSA